MEIALILTGILLIVAIIILLFAGVKHWQQGNDILDEIRKWENERK